MARKKIISEEVREKSQKLKKLITIIIFIVMLAIMACYALGLDNYLHPKPKDDPEVSAWGTNVETQEDDDTFDWESAKENEGESGQSLDDSVEVTDPYKDTVTTEETTGGAPVDVSEEAITE